VLEAGVIGAPDAVLGERVMAYVALRAGHAADQEQLKEFVRQRLADYKVPESIGGSPVTMHLYVEDVDATFARAVAAGAKAVRPVADQFYGDRAGKLVDPFGHSWFLATHKEDVAPEEIKRRAEEKFGKG